MQKIIAINTGKDFRLLDHLAPLASLLDIPLYLTEERNVDLCNKYYPEVKTLYSDYDEFSLFKLAEKYSLLLQATFWDKDLTLLLKSIHPNLRFGFVPHGNSDKGHLEPLLVPLAHHDFSLLYGEHMIDRLKKQNISPPPHLFTGNFRLHYYLQKKQFFQNLADAEIFSKLNNKNPTILYAPSWNDAEGGTSFFSHVKTLIASLPSSYNLIIKTHPLLEEMHPARYYASLPEIENRDNCLILSEFPLIFPLLDKVQIYLGDTSSIGYDFLYFQKPMFFFNPYPNLHTNHPSLLIHQAGITIPHDEKNPFQFIEKRLSQFNDEKKTKQKDLWTFAFGKEVISPDSLKQQITRLLNSCP